MSAPPAESFPTSLPASAGPRGRLPLASTVVLAVLVKVALIVYLGGQMYSDVRRALNFAWLIDHGAASIHTAFINDKTFIGPLLWYGLHDKLGVAGLCAFNLIAFLGLCVAVHRMGQGRFADPSRAIAMVLFAFFVGTHRNIVAGEPDDNLAALLFVLGILSYLRGRRAFLAGVLVGIAFLFKFWIPIFAIGFLAFLLKQRRWGEAGIALVGMALPFAAINGADRLASLHSLLFSIGLQHGFSSWSALVFKLVSTGLLPIAIVATLAWWRRRDEVTTLLWLLSLAYPIYALVNRDAFSASFVLMVTMAFASLLLAEGLLAFVERLPSRWRLAAVVCALVLYLAGTTAITHHHLARDTVPVLLAKDAEQARRLSYAHAR